jgi:hypothetical protein
MKLKLSTVLLALLVLLPATARAEGRALFLQKVYMSFCLKHFDDYAALRADLIDQRLPKLPPQQAAHFLQGQEGDAWPVPYEGQFGQFVLALPAGDNRCAVMARRADPAKTEGWFRALAQTAPEPLVVQPVSDRSVRTPLSGQARQQSWTWSAAGAEQRLELTLTTAAAVDASIQVVASLAVLGAEQQEP